MTSPMPGPEPPSDFRPKSRKPLVGAALVGLIIGGLGTVGVTLAVTSTAKQPAARSAPKKAAEVEPPTAADAGADAADAGPAKDPLAAKAESGDPEAVQAIAALELSERSAEQVVALDRSEAEAKRQEIAELVRKIELVPKLGQERSTVTAVREFAKDARVAGDLVLGLAGLPGTIGPDLLYKIGPGAWGRSPAKELARDALYAKDVRSKASPALGVYLDLSLEDNDCEAVIKILERAKTSADRRSLRLLNKLTLKRGCGPAKRNDCWPCLRTSDLLKDATVAARKRR